MDSRFDAGPSCSGATGPDSWSKTNARVASSASANTAVRSLTSTFGRMFNGAMHGRGAGRHLSTDHDPLIEAHRWTANLRILDLDAIKTVPSCASVTSPFVERLIGTTPREWLDPVLSTYARDLERTLGDFQAYYNEVRFHAALTFAGGHTAWPAPG